MQAPNPKKVYKKGGNMVFSQTTEGSPVRTQKNLTMNYAPTILGQLRIMVNTKGFDDIRCKIVSASVKEIIFAPAHVFGNEFYCAVNQRSGHWQNHNQQGRERRGWDYSPPPTHVQE